MPSRCGYIHDGNVERRRLKNRLDLRLWVNGVNGAPIEISDGLSARNLSTSDYDNAILCVEVCHTVVPFAYTSEHRTDSVDSLEIGIQRRHVRSHAPTVAARRPCRAWISQASKFPFVAGL